MTIPNKRLVLVLLLLAFTPYLYLSYYANPSGDDLIYGHLGKSDHFITTLIYQYINWSGRYTSNVFALLNPMSFDSLLVYKMMPVGIIIISILALVYFLKTLIGNAFSRVDRYIIATSLTLLYIYQMPTIADGLYWYTGAVTYQLGNTFAICFLSLLISFYQKKHILSNVFIHSFTLTLIIFLTIGFNEVLMVMMVCFSLIFLLFVFTKKLPNKLFAVYIALITLSCSAIVLLAPGNYIRESQFENNHQLIHSLLYSLAQTIRFFIIWISSAPLFLMSIVFFFINKRLTETQPLFAQSFYLNPIYSTLLLFFIIFISVFPAYWATGILGQHRTLNVAYYFFIILWFINLNVWFNYFKNKLILVQIPHKKAWFAFLFIGVGCFAFAKNGYDVCTDLINGNAKSYDHQIKERFEIARSANDTIFFDPILNPPKSLSIYDIKDDPNHWLNRAWSRYFECEQKPVIKK